MKALGQDHAWGGSAEAEMPQIEQRGQSGDGVSKVEGAGLRRNAHSPGTVGPVGGGEQVVTSCDSYFPRLPLRTKSLLRALLASETTPPRHRRPQTQTSPGKTCTSSARYAPGRGNCQVVRGYHTSSQGVLHPATVLGGLVCHWPQSSPGPDPLPSPREASQAMQVPRSRRKAKVPVPSQWQTSRWRS